MKKPSFLERLVGSVQHDDHYDDEFDSEEFYEEEHAVTPASPSWEEEPAVEEAVEGELPIDMYRTPDAIVIRALVAGVDPNNLDIAITRDMVTISGKREEIQESSDDDYYHRELFWGSFTRSVVLPEEIAIDEAEAREKHGYLEIILPKVDKNRSTKLNVKSHGK